MLCSLKRAPMSTKRALFLLKRALCPLSNEFTTHPSSTLTPMTLKQSQQKTSFPRKSPISSEKSPMSSQTSWLHTRAAYCHISYGTEAKPAQNFLPSKPIAFEKSELHTRTAHYHTTALRQRERTSIFQKLLTAIPTASLVSWPMISSRFLFWRYYSVAQMCMMPYVYSSFSSAEPYNLFFFLKMLQGGQDIQTIPPAAKFLKNVSKLNARSSKLERLFSLKHGKRDI